MSGDITCSSGETNDKEVVHMVQEVGSSSAQEGELDRRALEVHEGDDGHLKDPLVVARMTGWPICSEGLKRQEPAEEPPSS